MTPLNLLTSALLALSLFFFAAGTAGLWRFPDLYSRLHALTKADNLGLGLAVVALMLQAETAAEVFKLGLIWALVLAASATVSFLIGNEAQRRGLPPWRQPRGSGLAPGLGAPSRPVRSRNPDSGRLL